MSRLHELFEDSKLVEKIQNQLPSLFDIAESESSRGGRIGMEVGSKREQILIALLMYKFGEQNIQMGSVTEYDIDALMRDYLASQYQSRLLLAEAHLVSVV